MHNFDQKHQNFVSSASSLESPLKRFGLDGAGDGDRTRDIQLGKLAARHRSTQNQAFRAGHTGQNVALAALIEHTIEHNFLAQEISIGNDPFTARIVAGSGNVTVGNFSKVKAVMSAFTSNAINKTVLPFCCALPAGGATCA